MSVLRRTELGAGKKGVAFWCPGCLEPHVIDCGPGGWGFNGDPLKPTFTPSVLVRSGHYASGHKPGDFCWCTHNAEHPEVAASFSCSVCHSFVTDGVIRFLGDCSHAMANKEVPLAPWGEGKEWCWP